LVATSRIVTRIGREILQIVVRIPPGRHYTPGTSA
jgi:hypothetical protein